MTRSNYPTLADFIKNNELQPNQNLSSMTDGNYRINNLKFQEFDEASNILFLNSDGNSDCIAVGLNSISRLEIDKQTVWHREVYNNA